MCGIAGCVDFTMDLSTEKSLLEQMGSTLVCRGPDESGLWISPRAAFAHRRLIVIDPEGGRQPMIRSHEGHLFSITYNGELYNMNELRSELLARGHTLRSRSDTELVLQSYIAWGPDCVERFNGIFALGIWDETRQTLFLARDRLGVKPLFYAEKPNLMVFGSELKAVLAHPAIEPRVDLEGLAELLFIGPARTPGHAVFREIRELRPGHRVLFSPSQTVIEPYWQLQAIPHADDVEATTVRVRQLLEDAVSRQLVSDVPIATLLSGGLDSSAVSACANKALQKSGRGPLRTFSVDFADMEQHFQVNAFQTGNDAPWVRRVAEYLGTDHTRIELDTPELVNSLTRPLAARDLPGMADIDISLLLFCEEIKKTVTVALSGEAADEIFGGYPWFHREEALSADTFPWSLQLDRRMSVIAPELVERIRPHEYVAARYREALSEISRLAGEESFDARIREITYLSITRFLPTLLERKDRMSMAVGLEVRVPFCDHRLVQYVWNIPWSLRNLNGTAKGILRRAVEDLLPDDVVYRRKTPYPSTHNPEYAAALRTRLEDILADPDSPILPLLDIVAVRDLMETSKNPSEHRPWFGQIMGIPQMFDYLIQINVWLKQYNVMLEW